MILIVINQLLARPKLSSLSLSFELLKHVREKPVRICTVKLFFAWLGVSASYREANPDEGKMVSSLPCFRNKFHLQLHLCCNYFHGRSGQNLGFDALIYQETRFKCIFPSHMLHAYLLFLIYSWIVLRNGWKGPEYKLIVLLLLFRQFRVKHYMNFERDKISSRTLYLTTLPQLLCMLTAVMK